MTNPIRRFRMRLGLIKCAECQAELAEARKADRVAELAADLRIHAESEHDATGLADCGRM
jgi:predicted small metal-binding protein